MTPQQHYRDSVTNALAGYQMLEGLLKLYAETYYDVVRIFIAGRLHFDFHRKDVEAAPLGRLISGFARTCNNKRLVGELRDLVSHRDEVAHQALLCLYGSGVSEDKFHDMIERNHEIIEKQHRLQTEVLAEVTLVHQKSELALRG